MAQQGDSRALQHVHKMSPYTLDEGFCCLSYSTHFSEVGYSRLALEPAHTPHKSFFFWDSCQGEGAMKPKQ